jgi:hypothetical protein
MPEPDRSRTFNRWFPAVAADEDAQSKIAVWGSACLGQTPQYVESSWSNARDKG